MNTNKETSEGAAGSRGTGSDVQSKGLGEDLRNVGSDVQSKHVDQDDKTDNRSSVKSKTRAAQSTTRKKVR